MEVCGHVNDEWYDGKKYEHICFRCASTIKHSHVIIHDEDDDTKDEWITYDNEKVIHLHTANEMVSDGWDKKEAETSLKAVKAALRKGKKTIARSK